MPNQECAFDDKGAISALLNRLFDRYLPAVAALFAFIFLLLRFIFCRF